MIEVGEWVRKRLIDRTWTLEDFPFEASSSPELSMIMESSTGGKSFLSLEGREVGRDFMLRELRS